MPLVTNSMSGLGALTVDSNFFASCQITSKNPLSKYLTADNCVVKEHEGDEGGVKDGEGDQQVVERVGHLLPKENFLGKVEKSHLTRENSNREKISHKSNKTHDGHQNSLVR